jgi:hypothetical protein
MTNKPKPFSPDRGSERSKLSGSEEIRQVLHFHAGRGMAQTRTRKSNPKKFRGSAFEVNQNLVIDSRNTESCLMTLKVKKSSKLGLKTSTVGLIKMTVSDLMHIISRNKHSNLIWLRLYDESRNPVGTVGIALLGMELKIDGLPEDIPNPAEVKRQRHIKEAKKNPAVENLIPDVPKPTINLKRKLDEFLHE